MNKNTPKTPDSEKKNFKHFTKLQPLKLEHLDRVAGGTCYVYPCPDCPE
ncbi:MAG: hypothetical protein QNJ55_33650 [Xenococcus sp. MO_188.B8]|nr:hypothetical protein [Xenococcus sp. MO_188.B8]